MSTFQFDTSGEVLHPAMLDPRAGDAWITLRWSDLTPFAQGYVEAILTGPVQGVCFRPLGFSDLSPSALGMILKDCEAWCTLKSLGGRNPSIAVDKQLGADCWRNRMGRHYTVSLGADGKVYLTEGVKS